MWLFPSENSEYFFDANALYSEKMTILYSLRFVWQAYLVVSIYDIDVTVESFSFSIYQTVTGNSWQFFSSSHKSPPKSTKISSSLWRFHPFCSLYDIFWEASQLRRRRTQATTVQVASGFTLLSISMSLLLRSRANFSVSLSSSSNHRAKNNWTRDDWCRLAKTKRTKRARAHARAYDSVLPFFSHRDYGRIISDRIRF